MGKDVESYVQHLDAGGQITSGPQNIYRIRPGRYFLCCETEGCCDADFTEDELRSFLESDDWDWEILPTGTEA